MINMGDFTFIEIGTFSIALIASNSGHVVENSNSPHPPIAIQENNTFHTINEEQTKLITKLVENVIAMNEKIVRLLDKKEEYLFTF